MKSRNAFGALPVSPQISTPLESPAMKAARFLLLFSGLLAPLAFAQSPQQQLSFSGWGSWVRRG